jgi:antitoxin MazE
MKSRIHKWGNSLGLRIPKAMADEAGLVDQSPVEISMRDGELIVQALAPQKMNLRHMLREVTPENLHAEVDSGPPQGREVL